MNTSKESTLLGRFQLLEYKADAQFLETLCKRIGVEDFINFLLATNPRVDAEAVAFINSISKLEFQEWIQ